MKHRVWLGICTAALLSLFIAGPELAAGGGFFGSGDIEGIGPPKALAYGGGVASLASKKSLKFKIRTVYGKDGEAESEILLMEDYAVDKAKPRTFDRRTQIKYWVDGKGVPEVVLYGDKSAGTWRANGYRLAAPQGRPIVKVVFEPEKGKARIIWTDSQGKYKASYVTFLSKRGDEPPQSAGVLPVEDVDENYAQAAGLKDGGGASDPGGAATTLGGTGTAGADGKAKTEGKADGAGGIDLPGNGYGADPVLSDEEVRQIVNQYVSEEKAKVKEPGYRMNDWGVLEAGHLKHEGRIDDYPTHVHFWVGTSGAVQGRLQSAAQEKRARLEAAAKSAGNTTDKAGSGPTADVTPKGSTQDQTKTPVPPQPVEKPNFPGTTTGGGSDLPSESYDPRSK